MQVTISQYLNKEYLEYAKYVLASRAIPNIIDGFKPVHRKIFYTALKHCKNQFIKTAALSGFTIADSNYHHGDGSLNSAISLLTQNFVGSNNIPMFDGKGNFGNRLIPDFAAPRYTSVKLSNEFLKHFSDFDLVDKNLDLDDPEPITYLPNIPWVLVNGAEGIAIGFSTYILSRSEKLLKDVVKAKIKNPNKKFPYQHYIPYFKNFTGSIEYDNENHNWVITGLFEREKPNLIKIIELPVGYTREKYISHLDKLLDNKKIKDYEDFSKNSFSIKIKTTKILRDDEVIKLFKLRTSLTENINVIGTDGKLYEFKNPDDLIDIFIKYRLKKYQERIDVDIATCKNELNLIEEKIKFLILIKDKKIDPFNIKSKTDLVAKLEKHNFKFIKELINIPIYNMIIEEIDKLNLEKINIAEKILPKLESTKPEDLWLTAIK